MSPISLGGVPVTINQPRGRALLVTRDLMLESQVTGSAAQVGIQLDIQASFELAQRASIPAVQVVLVDLNLGTTGLTDLVAFWTSQNDVPVLAFGSHVATALLDAARSAGCREVFPRSRLNAQAGQILSHYCCKTDATGG